MQMIKLSEPLNGNKLLSPCTYKHIRLQTALYILFTLILGTVYKYCIQASHVQVLWSTNTSHSFLLGAAIFV